MKFHKLLLFSLSLCFLLSGCVQSNNTDNTEKVDDNVVTNSVRTEVSDRFFIVKLKSANKYAYTSNYELVLDSVTGLVYNGYMLIPNSRENKGRVTQFKTVGFLVPVYSTFKPEAQMTYKDLIKEFGEKGFDLGECVEIVPDK